MGTRRAQQQVCNLRPGFSRQKLIPTPNTSKGNGPGWFVPQLITFQYLISRFWTVADNAPRPDIQTVPSKSRSCMFHVCVCVCVWGF